MNFYTWPRPKRHFCHIRSHYLIDKLTLAEHAAHPTKIPFRRPGKLESFLRELLLWSQPSRLYRNLDFPLLSVPSQSLDTRWCTVAPF